MASRCIITHLIARRATRMCRPFSMDAKLDAVQLVEIDGKGRFKYILIKVFAASQLDDSGPSKLIVRGFQWAKWHNDIFEKVTPGIQALGLNAKCLGGGRIEHYPDEKKLKVFGHSTAFGRAEHSESRKVLLTKFDDYNIEISDEGY